MGDWWIDETPTPDPGPPSPEEVRQAFIQLGHRVAKVYGKQSQQIIESLQKLGLAFADAEKEAKRLFPQEAVPPKVKVRQGTWQGQSILYSEFNGHIHMHIDPGSRPPVKPKRTQPPVKNLGPRPKSNFGKRGKKTF